MKEMQELHTDDWTVADCGMIWIEENEEVTLKTLTPYDFLLKTENEVLNNAFLHLLWILFHRNNEGKERNKEIIQQAMLVLLVFTGSFKITSRLCGNLN